jgi:hypothetical protein
MLATFGDDEDLDALNVKRPACRRGSRRLRRTITPGSSMRVGWFASVALFDQEATKSRVNLDIRRPAGVVNVTTADQGVD